MKTFTYTSSTGSTVNLYEPVGLLVGQIMELRTRQWDWTLGYRSLTANRPARTVKFTALCRSQSMLEAAERLFDADVRAYVEEQVKPGMLEVDGWRQTALIVKAEPDYVSPQLTRVEFTAALFDGVWHKPVTRQFSRNTARYTSGKGYSYDYRYDYVPTRASAVLSNDSALPSRVKYIIYGAATSPAITIGGNKVIADVSIPSGGYLIIDGTGSPRTAVLTAANGDQTNVFDKLRRDQANNEYAFATLQPGVSQVSWDESFSFDIEYWMERTGLPWT
ncbi:hypothetical protein BLI708_00395 [Bifidobacterium imperatoris]|uniref:Uncharacterized protein n=1 Tax=Bifidobacterium imperatoris TaxID=2020965 RepID=A0A2N5IPB2_9BIFI|nr:hypothetical protein [Bifidobacterium imperatoris]PLS23776.1 hypothetical protein Tam1G_2167 [Bifidobacterium imperatoris]QSY57788.1 hypothetical protein BLI708_00100 [Bifidobacterium imperatoris]QSY57837.1 hypothetical protein BLI708_00395 [Bifidobacterium imperatoris]